MKSRTIILFVLHLILFAGCKKCKEPEPDTDPCNSYQTTSAQFSIEEEYYSRWFESDTIMCGNDIHFTAAQSGIGYSYEWHIGNDPRTFGTKQVLLFFINPTIINVQLIIRRTPDIRCNPNDDGIDTINKTMVAIKPLPGYPGSPYPGLVGNFKGHYSTSPNLETTVSIRPVYHHTQLSDTTFEITNYPVPGCNDPQFKSFFFNYCYRAVRLFDGGPIINASCINTTDSWAVVDTSGNNLRIDFKIADLQGNLTPAYFVGTKQ